MRRRKDGVDEAQQGRNVALGVGVFVPIMCVSCSLGGFMNSNQKILHKTTSYRI